MDPPQTPRLTSGNSDAASAGRGWRIAHNGVVFTGASSVTVTRYRYRGSEHPDPLDTPTQPPPAAEQRARHVESRMRGDTHVRFGGRAGKRTRGNPDSAPVPDPTPATAAPPSAAPPPPLPHLAKLSVARARTDDAAEYKRRATHS